MLSELLDEIENRLRQIVREEVKAALLELKDPTSAVKFRNNFERKRANDSKNLPELLTAPQVAEILGVSVQRVYEITRQRKSTGFPVIVIGERSYRFSKEAILEWIARDNQ